MTTPWLSIVGIGEDGLAGVTPAGRALIETAAFLFGGERHLAMVPLDHPAERRPWKSPLTDSLADLRTLAGRRVCVLATGNPLSYGIGEKLLREFGPEAITIIPASDAFSLAAARLGWPLRGPDIDCLTLHGRPLDIVNLHLRPKARLLILTENGDCPAKLATHLTITGWGESRLTVLEHMGGRKERRKEGIAKTWHHARCADLNVVAAQCEAGPDAQIFSRLAGLPDEAFVHDGQLTKREVRATTLAALAPQPGELLWDVGAGCGSIAIEWMRAGGQAIAIEQNTDRCTMIATNAARLGVPGLEIVAGTAPDALAGLPVPDAVFVGGGLAGTLNQIPLTRFPSLQSGNRPLPEGEVGFEQSENPGEGRLLETCHTALKLGGRLVSNAVTAGGEAALLAAQARWGGDLTRLAISRLSPVGGQQGWRPLMPVTQYCMRKTGA